MIEQSEEVRLSKKPIPEVSPYSDLKRDVTFLQSYGFVISYDYVDMLLEQIRLRDKEQDA